MKNEENHIKIELVYSVLTLLTGDIKIILAPQTCQDKTQQIHFHYKVLVVVSSSTTKLLPSFLFVNQDDDIHILVTMKQGFILSQYYCMKTHHRHNQMQDYRTMKP
jgi:hypothetical protein